jgi:hypothetical protein
MLNNERNDLYYKNNDKKVNGFTLDGICQFVSVGDRSWLLRTSCYACPPSLSGRPLMHGGRLICRSRRAQPADDGLHLLLQWRNVSYITPASPPSYSFSACDTLLVLVYSSGGGRLQPLSLGLEFAPCLRHSAALVATGSSIPSH